MKLLNLSVAVVMAMLFCVNTLFAQTKNEDKKQITAKGYAALDEKGVMEPHQFKLRALEEKDILVEILYSGVCHSDVHQACGHWGNSLYPMVPGHEIVGRVKEVGSDVKNFKLGDHIGIGPMINSCGECSRCSNGQEQYCENRKTVYTYNARDWEHNNEVTNGGYADYIVVNERFALTIPAGAPLDKIGPLFCAGVTTYVPLVNGNIKKGDPIAVAGFGGLGHLALQYAVSMGAEVTVFDISESKRAEAMAMGATKYVNVNNPEELKGMNSSFKMILNLIPANYDVAMYIKMLKVDGEMVLIGQPSLTDVPSVSTQVFVENPGRKVYFSLIGGIKVTQEMLHYSIKHNIFPTVEVIPMDKINEAFKKLVSGDVKYRYVIDMSTLK
jgi:uncharacterized zinc-type alcohol dehydrogenase-like protein